MRPGAVETAQGLKVLAVLPVNIQHTRQLTTVGNSRPTHMMSSGLCGHQVQCGEQVNMQAKHPCTKSKNKKIKIPKKAQDRATVAIYLTYSKKGEVVTGDNSPGNI